MGIIQHIVADEYGMFVGKHSERLQISKDGKVVTQAPLMFLESVTVANSGISLSADAVRECAERGIPIYFISEHGEPYASLYSSGLTGTVITRRAQLLAYDSPCGFQFIFTIILAKLQNQANLLRYIAKYRKETNPPLFEELNRIVAEIADESIAMSKMQKRTLAAEPVPRMEDIRGELMGLEGRAAARYWDAIRQVIPDKYEFPGRVGRGASDAFNSALNYGYGILYGICERSLVLAGLDPYAGFLHADRPGKPSMVFDFIEEYRQAVVDRTVIGLANKNVTIDLDDKSMLTKETRGLLVEKIHERLEAEVDFEKKNYPLRSVIQMQARHLATFLRGEREEYVAYVLAW